ncbi:MAG TPA: class II aldolase/adducin family protein [Candidatus Acidoferrales bacterium]|nr:class II aldolase/adducin family protein [Candidatus Acidoferrales bacterium]
MPENIVLPGHSKSEEQHRRDLCTVGQWMYDRGHIVACEGNLSVRLDSERILTTPTCMNKGSLSPADLVVTDLQGRQIGGERKASSELAMHVLIYREREDVNAICHAHPPTATGFAVSGRALDRALLPEVIVGLGLIPLARYGTPGTPELGASIEPLIPHYDAILLANHGAVTCGPDLLTAFQRMETVEQCAKITLAAELTGEPNLLSSREVAKLMAARARYFAAMPPGGGAELPITSDDAERNERVTLTRPELEALIDDAVKKDRSRR